MADFVDAPHAPATEAPRDETAPRTIVTNGRQLGELLAETLEAVLAANTRNPRRPVLYVRSGALARVVKDEAGCVTLALVDDGALTGILATVARWETVTAGKDGAPPKRTSAFPPATLVKAFLCLGQWPGLPPLAGLVHAPYFDASGALHTEAGYSRAAGLYNTAALEVGDTTPTPDAVAAATAMLQDELLGDFPFSDKASRAHALALLLLPFVRPLIAGPTPLHAIDAPMPGTGKSLLTDTCAAVANGRGAAAMAAGRDEEEWRKRLISALLAGASHVLIDNVTTALDSGVLSGVLTAHEFEDRGLGTNRILRAPVRCVWAVTANNLQPSGEIARRMLWIRLDANAERPWQREGFRHTNLKAWALENRGRLVGAAVTLVRNWIENAQQQPFTARRKGSYEAWARTVGGVLEAAGVPGFLANDDALYEGAVTDAGAWRAFVEAWAEAYGTADTPTAALFRLASFEDQEPKGAQAAQGGLLGDEEAGEYRNLLGDMLGSGKRETRLHKLGIELRKAVGRVVNTAAGTFKIAKGGAMKGKARWRLDALQNPARVGVSPNPYPAASGATSSTEPGTAELYEARVGVGRGSRTPLNARENQENTQYRIGYANPYLPLPNAPAEGSTLEVETTDAGRGSARTPTQPPAPGLDAYLGRWLTYADMEEAFDVAHTLQIRVRALSEAEGWRLEVQK